MAKVKRAFRFREEVEVVGPSKAAERALSIWNAAIDRFAGEMQIDQPDRPNLDDVYDLAIFFCQRLAIHKGQPNLSDVQKKLRGIDDTLSRLITNIEDLGDIDLLFLDNLFREHQLGEISLDLHLDGYSISRGANAKILELLTFFQSKFHEAAERATQSVERYGTKSNRLGVSPTHDLVEAAFDLWTTFCPTEIRQNQHSLFAGFIEAVHQLATGRKNACGRAIRDVVGSLQ